MAIAESPKVQVVGWGRYAQERAELKQMLIAKDVQVRALQRELKQANFLLWKLKAEHKKRGRK